MNQSLRNAVAGLSSGRYYNQVSDWWIALVNVMNSHGYKIEQDFPEIHIRKEETILLCPTFWDENSSKSIAVRTNVYKMPVSGNYEIICYIVG